MRARPGRTQRGRSKRAGCGVEGKQGVMMMAMVERGVGGWEKKEDGRCFLARDSSTHQTSARKEEGEFSFSYSSTRFNSFFYSSTLSPLFLLYS
jgi:hypothetical protein